MFLVRWGSGLISILPNTLGPESSTFFVQWFRLQLELSWFLAPNPLQFEGDWALASSLEEHLFSQQL